MIDKIIGRGYYRFEGTIRDLKKHLGKFKVTEVLTDGWIQGINVYAAMAEFRYHGMKHIILIASDFSDSNILNLEYKGMKKYERNNNNNIRGI